MNTPHEGPVEGPWTVWTKESECCVCVCACVPPNKHSYEDNGILIFHFDLF